MKDFLTLIVPYLPHLIIIELFNLLPTPQWLGFCLYILYGFAFPWSNCTKLENWKRLNDWPGVRMWSSSVKQHDWMLVEKWTCFALKNSQCFMACVCRKYWRPFLSPQKYMLLLNQAIFEESKAWEMGRKSSESSCSWILCISPNFSELKAEPGLC